MKLCPRILAPMLSAKRTISSAGPKAKLLGSGSMFSHFTDTKVSRSRSRYRHQDLLSFSGVKMENYAGSKVSDIFDTECMPMLTCLEMTSV